MGRIEQASTETLAHFGSPASSGSSASRSRGSSTRSRSRRLVEFDGWALVADHLTHTVVPVMAVPGWLMYGPRGQASWAVVRLVLLYPLGYIVFTLVRGAVVDFYPYHFTDVAALGYAKVAANCAWDRAPLPGGAGGYRRPTGWIVVR